MGLVKGGLTIYQEGPEQAQDSKADVLVLLEAVQVLLGKQKQPLLLQLFRDQPCGQPQTLGGKVSKKPFPSGLMQSLACLAGLFYTYL